MMLARVAAFASCIAIFGANSAFASTTEVDKPIASLQQVNGKVLVNYAAIEASAPLKAGDFVLVSDGATATAVFKDCQIVVPPGTANTVEELYNHCVSADVKITPTADMPETTEVDAFPLLPLLAGGLLAGGVVTTIIILEEENGGEGGDGGVSDPN